MQIFMNLFGILRCIFHLNNFILYELLMNFVAQIIIFDIFIFCHSEFSLKPLLTNNFSLFPIKSEILLLHLNVDKFCACHEKFNSFAKFDCIAILRSCLSLLIVALIVVF